jgi:cation/acetate symporter
MPPLNLSFAVPGLTVTVFVALAVVLLGMQLVARRAGNSPDEFYVSGRRFGAWQNGLALFSSFIMLTTLFTMTGYIALDGLDAMLFAGGFSLSWMVALLFLTDPMRNTKARTLGELFAVRLPDKPARTAGAVVSLVMYVTYIIITTNAFGIIAEFLLGMPSLTAKSWLVAIMGVLTVLYVFAGGRNSTTRLLWVKAALVIGITAVLAIAVLVMYRLDLLKLVHEAGAKAPPVPGNFPLLAPGRQYSADTVTQVGFISKLFTVVVGASILPYLFMQNAAAKSGREARRSVAVASSLMVPFYLCTVVLALGALGILGGQNVGVLPPTRDITLPTLADRIGGPWLVAILGATALLIVAGMVATLLISAVTSYMVDIHAPRHRDLEPAAELRAAKRTTLAIGLGSVVLGVVLLPYGTHFLIPTTVNLAAAAILPAVVYLLFWKRFNTSGLRWSVYGGMAITAFLVFFSIGVSGDRGALFPNADFHFVPNVDVGLLTVPITFLLGYLGTIRSRENDPAAFAELQVRALTGVEFEPARQEQSLHL